MTRIPNVLLAQVPSSGKRGSSLRVISRAEAPDLNDSFSPTEAQAGPGPRAVNRQPPSSSSCSVWTLPGGTELDPLPLLLK